MNQALNDEIICAAMTVFFYKTGDMGSSKKSCSKGVLESCGLPGAKRVFAMEYYRGPSLCKFSRYLVVIKIMDIRHKICHIYYKNAYFESILLQKYSLHCCYMCAKFSSTCKIIFIFSCILSFSFMGQLFMDDPILKLVCFY